MKQMKKQAESVAVEADLYKRVLKCEGEVVLTLSIRTPRLPETSPALRRIGRYYHHAGQCWRARWETKLYAQACASLAEMRAQSYPFHPWEAVLDFTVSFNENCLLSLYMDSYEFTGGAHGNTVRCGDTWDLCNGMPRTLPTFYPPKSHWRREAVAAVHTEIERRLATGEYLYLDGWEQEVITQFDPCRFYLTGDGVTLFYPLYTLAPYVEGIPTFLIVKWENR